MTPFLKQVAASYFREYGADIHQLAFVFPNRRAGLFFQKYLSEIAGRPLFSPTILTINDLFVKLSGKQPADRINMLFLLYEHYVRLSGTTETFDDFLYWGEMLLNDFDDVDKYMADARMLFMNVTDLREIDGDYSFLSDEQIAAIRSFWSSFNPLAISTDQQEFLTVWKLLFSLYTELRNSLANEQKGYEGMIMREVVEKLEQGTCDCSLPYRKVVFVGLNALSVVEERFLLQLQKQGIADFYWDYASDKVCDKENRASHFVERNRRLFPSEFPLEEEPQIEPQIEVIGIPSAIGQAKQVYTLLNDLIEHTEGLTDEEALRTAVVLPDEHLLIPVLNAIPEKIRRINVTMGYPLAGTPIASLMDFILSLQKNVRQVDEQPMFYYRDIQPILSHRYISTTAPVEIAALQKEMRDNNRIYMSAEELGRTPLLEILFTPVTEVFVFSDYLIRVLLELNTVMNTLAPVEEETPQRTDDLEQEFIFHYYTTVNRLREIMTEAGVDMKIETYFRLLKRLTETITIPFHGEPLSGLQIMGVLETRALDFDRLIILSMNEGIFPLRKAASSFIPYNLRRGFGLPTYEHQDSVWAYHFYRLIYRASQVSLLYDTRSNGLQTGEVSRFIHQLRYHYQLPLHNRLVVYNVSSVTMPVLQVEKTVDVMLRMQQFYKGGNRAISASAINTYLDCPLKFYFSIVEKIEEEEEVSEMIESNVFGSILHKVMEELYEPFCHKPVTADLLKAIRNDNVTLTGAIGRAFAEVFFKSDVMRPLSGKNYLIGEMIRKYVDKILESDSKLTPFRYLRSELRINRTIRLNDYKQTEIQLKGFIDRVDEVGDRVRIIDYKSGLGFSLFKNINSLFDKTEKKRAKAIMQVFFYAWMYGEVPYGMRLQPAIYYLRSLFGNSFDPVIEEGFKKGNTVKVLDFSEYKDDYEAALRTCLTEIFDERIPFTQTVNEEHCSWCMFKVICGKLK